MAYILGFFIADGTIPREIQTVSFSQKESYILEDIKKEIGSNQPLYKNQKTGVHILNLNSKSMKTDLMELHGIMPNKSYDVLFPYVPEEHTSHFVRGYFDGDGYVNYNKHAVTFVGGSLSFMNTLMQILGELGYRTNYNTNGRHHRVHITGRRSIILFSNWIYNDKGLYLMFLVRNKRPAIILMLTCKHIING